MCFELSDELRKFKEEVRNFVQTEILPVAEDSDYNEKISLDVVKKMASRGYLGASISEAFGGKGWDQLKTGVLVEEIGRGCSSLRSLLTVHLSLVSETLERCGTKSQKEYWLPELTSGRKIAAFCLTEENAGSDAQAITGTYDEDVEGYVINCKKKYVTFGQSADVFLVFARNGKEVSAFLVDGKTPGVSTIPMHGLLGLRAAMVANVEFSNVKVHKDRLIGAKGFGLIHIMNTALDNGRYSVALGSLGIAKAALSASIQFANSRKQFNSLIKDFQLTKRKITEMTSKARAASLLCYSVGMQRNARHQDALIQCCIAKYYTTTIASEIAREAVQIHGALGCLANSPVQRYFRDSKIMEIIEGSSEIQQVIIADHVMSNHKQGTSYDDWN